MTISSLGQPRLVSPCRYNVAAALRLTVACLLISVACPSALAHDGGFGHSRRTVMITGSKADDGATVTIDYRLRVDNEAALLELTQMDTDGDGEISGEEQDVFLNAKATRLARRMHALVTTVEKGGKNQGNRLPVAAVTYRVQHSLVQIFRFRVSVENGIDAIQFHDSNYTHKPGSVRLYAGANITVEPAEQTNMHHADRLVLNIAFRPSSEPDAVDAASAPDDDGHRHSAEQDHDHAHEQQE